MMNSRSAETNSVVANKIGAMRRARGKAVSGVEGMAAVSIVVMTTDFGCGARLKG